MAISNNSTGLRPGVCTSSTRPTAPYEGQTIYETDTDLTYVWGGSAWQQVSGGTAVGNSGLVYITSVTGGSGVSSIAVSNCFSATYDNYVVNINNMTQTASNGNYLRFALNNITGNYWYGNGYYQTAGSGTLYGFHNTGSASNYIGVTDPYFSVNINLFSPFATAYKSLMSQYSAGGVSGYNGVAQGNAGITTSCTGFTISASASTLTGGVITVYGYRK